MIFEAASGARADAGLGIDDIDGAATTSDQASGRVIESMVTNGGGGCVGRVHFAGQVTDFWFELSR